MQDIKEGIEKLADAELINTYLKHDTMFNTTHEGYAVLLEEIEEAKEEFERIEHKFEQMWYRIKTDEVKETLFQAKRMRESATNAAAELIQVIAMCNKYIDSFED